MAVRNPPITVALLESYLDHLAHLMVDYAPDFDACLPLYERLEAEIESLRDREQRMAAVYARAKKLKPEKTIVKKLKNQMVEQSG